MEIEIITEAEIERRFRIKDDESVFPNGILFSQREIAFMSEKEKGEWKSLELAYKVID